MKHDLASRSIQAVIWSYVGAIGKIFAQLIIQVWLARMLGPGVFGQYAAVLVVIGFGWLIADCGFGAALIQKKEITDDDVGYALGWILVLSALCGTMTILSAPYLADAIGDPQLSAPFMACGPIIALQAISNLSSSLMRRNLDAKRDQIIHICSYVFGFGLLAILLAYLEMGIWSLVIGFLVQTLIVLIASYLIVQHTLIPKLTGDKGLGVFGLNVLGTNLTNWAIGSIDRFLIGRQWGMSTLGAYSAASNLSQVPINLLVSSFQTVVFSSASRIQDDFSRLRQGYATVLSLASVITFPLAAFLAMKSNFIITLLYGNKWEKAGILFSALCVALPFTAMISISGPMLWAIGAVDKEFKIQLITVPSLIAGLILLKNQPISIAVWIVPLIYLIRSISTYRILAKKINMSHKEAMHCIAGGSILTVIIVIIETASNYLLNDLVKSHIILNATQATIEITFCLIIIRTIPKYIIGSTLSTILLSHSQNSRFINLICQMAGFKEMRSASHKTPNQY